MAIIEPKFLSEGLLTTPTLALDAARMEGHRLGEIAFDMVQNWAPHCRHGTWSNWMSWRKWMTRWMFCRRKFWTTWVKIYKQELTEKQGNDLLLLIMGVDEIERIADTVRSDLIPLGRSIHEQDIEATDTIRHILTSLYERVCDSVRLSTSAIGDTIRTRPSKSST